MIGTNQMLVKFEYELNWYLQRTMKQPIQVNIKHLPFPELQGESLVMEQQLSRAFPFLTSLFCSLSDTDLLFWGGQR